MTTPNRAIIWDMDGVLVDSGDLHYEAWREVAATELDIDFTRELFDRIFGMSNVDSLYHLLGSDADAEFVERVGWQQDDVYRRLAAERVQPIPGAFELVRACDAAGWRQAVATSAPAETLDLILDKFDLRQHFDVAVSADEVARAKPDPALFILAAERLGTPREMCVVIEDSLNGVRAARAAGMACLAVTTTHDRGTLDGANHIVESLYDVTQADLAALLGGAQHSRER